MKLSKIDRKCFRAILAAVSFLVWSNYCVAAQSCSSESKESTPTSDFTIHGDGTATHTQTGLMWKQCPEGMSEVNCAIGYSKGFEWYEALEQAENSTFAGYDDWRLPNIKELATIIEYSCTSLALNIEVFPLEGGIFEDYFWSSTPLDARTAMWIRFDEGGIISRGGAGNSYNVRLVRDATSH